MFSSPLVVDTTKEGGRAAGQVEDNCPKGRGLFQSGARMDGNQEMFLGQRTESFRLGPYS